MNKYVVQLHVYKNIFQTRYPSHDDFYVIESNKSKEDIEKILNEAQTLTDEADDIRIVKFERGYVHMEPEYYASISVHRLVEITDKQLEDQEVDSSIIIDARG